MSVTAEELIDCAAALLRDAEDEPQFRAVCSRAYYGAFHAALAFHRQLPVPGTVGNARGRHEQLIAQLTSPMLDRRHQQYAASVAIGMHLRKLCDLRVKADYRLHDEVERENALDSTELAHTVLTRTT
jgi:uncharacterized protein (UPF0332 family)